jgi:ankyrin repeat protein
MKHMITLFELFSFILIFCSTNNNFDELHRVLQNNNTNKIKQHIDNGNINSIFINGYTPLMIAIENYNMKIVQFLVIKGVDINLWKTGSNPLVELACVS